MAIPGASPIAISKEVDDLKAVVSGTDKQGYRITCRSQHGRSCWRPAAADDRISYLISLAEWEH